MENDSELTVLEETQGIELYGDLGQQLVVAAKKNAELVFDYDSPRGAKDARSHINTMRGHKADLERERVRLKAESLETGRTIDRAANAMKSKFEEMIAVHKEPLDIIAQRDADRVAAIDTAINAIMCPLERLELMDVTPSSIDIAEAIELLDAIVIDADTYQERMAEGINTQKSLRIELLILFNERKDSEEKDAELDRLQKEQAAREQKEREDQIAAEAKAEAERVAEEAAAKAKADAEAARIKAEQDAKDEADRVALDAQKKLDAEQAKKDAAIAKAKEAKRSAAKREDDLKQDADRRVKEAEEKADRDAEVERQAVAKREADKKHVAQVNTAVREAFETCLSPEDAESATLAIIQGYVPHVSIKY